MTRHTFENAPQSRNIGLWTPQTATLTSERMLYSADWHFARAYGGSITQAILDRLDGEPHIRKVRSGEVAGRWVVIDTRVTMTMRGQWPAIPGWHCDGVPRPDKYGQPRLDQISPSVRHYAVILSDREGGVSNTEFLTEPVECVPNPLAIWESVNALVEAHQSSDATLAFDTAADGDLWEFGQNDLHRAMPAHHPGWRLFFRLTTYHRPPHNQVRYNTQVYVEVGRGW